MKGIELHLNPTPNPKNSPLGPQNVKKDPKLSQIQRSELKEKKMKVAQLYEKTPKQLSNPISTPKIAY